MITKKILNEVNKKFCFVAKRVYIYTKLHKMPVKNKKDKKGKKRNEIRVYDIPQPLFDKIQKNAGEESRTDGKEILTFLKKNY